MTLAQPLVSGTVSPEQGAFLVLCLCAEWCTTCREYQPGFLALSGDFPQARFVWLDVEVHAEEMGDLEADDFPTLLILRDGLVLFFGPMLPHLNHLRRTLENFAEQSPGQRAAYARATPERSAWQENGDFRRLATLFPVGGDVAPD